jgi:hypothetical protein
MNSLFEIEGADLDLGYINIREGSFAAEREIREMLDAMWQTYEPYADPDFRPGFAHDPEGRFWEMYLGFALIRAGKSLLPRCDRQRPGGQPDICVLDGERRIWIEAIAPDRGDEGPDQVRGSQPINRGGSFEPVPVREAQLRLTSALWTKSQKVQAYLQTGVIGPSDVRLIAISGGRFGRHIPDTRLPLIISSVFPIGREFLTIDPEHGTVVGTAFAASPTIQRHTGTIPRTAFIDERFSHISGVIWSRISIGNMSLGGRPLTVVHNPHADVPMPHSWGVWDCEFVSKTSEDGWESLDILSHDQG